MSTLHEALRTLSGSETALAAFLSNSAQWIEAHASDLPEAERQELHSIAYDLDALVERRCLQKLDTGPAARFARSNPVGRRQLMFSATSVLLAAPLAALFASEGSAMSLSPTNPESGNGDGDASDASCNNSACDDSGKTCVDGVCENNYCKDTSDCSDTDCTNEIRCVDESNCTDGKCTNSGDCMDTSCADGECNNTNGCADSTCTDGACINTGNACSDTACDNTTCSNTMC